MVVRFPPVFRLARPRQARLRQARLRRARLRHHCIRQDLFRQVAHPVPKIGGHVRPL
jgi:hypothetical protein